MLSFVREPLLDAGLISSSTELSYNIKVTSGSNIYLEVGNATQNNWFHIKASCSLDLEQQFSRYQLARARFGELVPVPLLHTRYEEWNVLIMRSIDHRPVRRSDISTKSPRSQILSDLMRFNTLAYESCKDSTVSDFSNFLRELKSYFTTTSSDNSRILSFLDRINSDDLADISIVDQHGDFVRNNLGTNCRGLVIFDWEDYGEIKLAGFDIFILSMSLAGMDTKAADAIRDIKCPQSTPWSFAAEACETIKLPYSRFRSLVPVYLIAFRYLKKNYGEEIRKRFDIILDQVLL